MSVQFNLETPAGKCLWDQSILRLVYSRPRPSASTLCRLQRGTGSRTRMGEYSSGRILRSSTQSQAITSGFQGDLLIGEHAQGRELDVAILDGAEQERELFRRTYAVGSYRPLAAGSVFQHLSTSSLSRLPFASCNKGPLSGLVPDARCLSQPPRGCSAFSP